MNHKLLDQVVYLIQAKLGLKSHSISPLIWKDRIEERMIACQIICYEEYKNFLKTSPREMQTFIELIVNPETWFFREKSAFQYIKHLIKQKILKTSYLKILSLACSTGEEPYSIAISIFESGLSKYDFSVDALDISQKFLDQAKMGIYREKSFRDIHIDVLGRYFDLKSSGYSIKNKVQERVSFYQANLLENPVS